MITESVRYMLTAHHCEHALMCQGREDCPVSISIITMQCYSVAPPAVVESIAVKA
jgi:hypothetical protein